MSYQFEDATPVKIEGIGRKAEDNPFEGVVSSIALKVDEAGNPLAKAFTEEYMPDEEDRKKVSSRIRRLMTEAGNKVSPERVTVRVSESIVNDKKGNPEFVKFTFWTIKKKEKGSAATAVATTPQAVAVAEPAA